MDSVIIPGYVGIFSNSQTRYLTPALAWDMGSTIETFNIVPVDCTIKTLSVAVNAAPGVGKSFTFTLRKNGIDTAKILTISGASIFASESATEISFAAGDLINIKITPSGTPSGTFFHCGILAKTSSGVGITFGTSYGSTHAPAGSLIGSETEYLPVTGGRGNAYDNRTVGKFGVMPTSGTFSKLYIHGATATGAGKTYDITLQVNGINSTLTAQLTNASTIASDLSHSVSVSAGDSVCFKCVPTNSPSSTVLSASMCWTPAIEGESIHLTLNNLFSYATGYALLITGDTSKTAIYTNTVVPCTIKKLYIKKVDVMTSNYFDTTLLQNGANTALTARLNSVDTLVNDLTHEIVVAAGDLLQWKEVISGSVATLKYEYGFVTYIQPEAATHRMLVGVGL